MFTNTWNSTIQESFIQFQVFYDFKNADSPRRCLLQPGWGVHYSGKKASELTSPGEQALMRDGGGRLGGKSGRKAAFLPEGLPGVHLEASSMKVKMLPTLQALLNSWEAQLLSGALQVRKHWPFWALPLPLSFKGSVKALASSSPYSAVGGRKGNQSLQVFDNRVPSPDTEWLKVIFLLRKKKPFIILLGLSETTGGFASLAFRCKVRGHACPHPSSPLQAWVRRGRRFSGWSGRCFDGLFSLHPGQPSLNESRLWIVSTCRLHFLLIMSENLGPWARHEPARKGERSSGAFSVAGTVFFSFFFFSCFTIIYPYNSLCTPMRMEPLSLLFFRQRNSGPGSHLPETIRSVGNRAI